MERPAMVATARQRRFLRAGRDALTNSRTALIAHCRHWLRQQSIWIPSGGPATLPRRVREALPVALPAHIEAVLGLIEKLNEKIRLCDEMLGATTDSTPPEGSVESHQLRQWYFFNSIRPN